MKVGYFYRRYLSVHQVYTDTVHFYLVFFNLFVHKSKKFQLQSQTGESVDQSDIHWAEWNIYNKITLKEITGIPATNLVHSHNCFFN